MITKSLFWSCMHAKQHVKPHYYCSFIFLIFFLTKCLASFWQKQVDSRNVYVLVLKCKRWPDIPFSRSPYFFLLDVIRLTRTKSQRPTLPLIVLILFNFISGNISNSGLTLREIYMDVHMILQFSVNNGFLIRKFVYIWIDEWSLKPQGLLSWSLHKLNYLLCGTRLI